MNILRFDSVGGVGGDMILASLLDLGVDLDVLCSILATMDVPDFDITRQPFADHGFSGIRVTVSVPPPEDSLHRSLSDIVKLIENSNIADHARMSAVRIFRRLAEAEATVHNTTPEDVHFHEVGAMDSILDIVGSCIAINMLDVDRIRMGPLPVGRGITQGSHGAMPIPVPAVVELLRGHQIVQTDEPFELVTPTGAAVLTTLNEKGETAGEDQSCVITRTGVGFGRRKLNSRPNLIRAMLLETGTCPPQAKDNCLVLECNIDDTVPELIGSLSTKLMETGALDVFTTPIQMKKQRPGTLLTILCKPADREPLVDLVFTESTTFGIREYITHRSLLPRRETTVDTPYGKVRVKVGTWKGSDITRSPEHEDCLRLAEQNNVPVRTVYEAASHAASSHDI